jgi:hypothetical protein
MRYPGGKNSAGVFQRLINQIPPHDLYVEAFIGSGAVYRHKRRVSSIVIDADPAVAGYWRSVENEFPGLRVVQGDAISFLADFPFTERAFVYCDPPYLRSTRRSRKRIYRHEFSDEEHVRLLELLKRLPCSVMLSGYRSWLYDDALTTWRRLDFTASTRGGPAVESLWMNYPEPAALADYSHLGESFRERQDFKRLKARWRARLAAMPELRRRALLEVLSGTATADLPRTATLGGNADTGSLIGAAAVRIPPRARIGRAAVVCDRSDVVIGIGAERRRRRQ